MSATCAARICALTLNLGTITALQKAAIHGLDMRRVYVLSVYLLSHEGKSEEALMCRSKRERFKGEARMGRGGTKWVSFLVFVASLERFVLLLLMGRIDREAHGTSWLFITA